ncbi:MAG: Rrf2 family transcriptional regulator [Alphaproteobacteria bacterium]|nr:Rrf2 family transcriptional regulator [Alphaproteobacteria bacterium]
MLLSTKGRYAVMAMVDLATQKNDRPLTLAGIAERQEIPLAYLEQIFAKLKKRGIVKSVRGPGGGYQLAKAAHDTNVAEIVIAADESIKMTRCNNGSHEGCMAPKTRCLTHDLWEGLGYQIFNYLKSVSLADVCERKLKQKFPLDPQEAANMYMLAEMMQDTTAHA